MKAPGVTVRPLKQITGDAEFNEVFFEDVRIPDSMRVGQEGAGWQVATTTLMNERVALGSGTTGGMPKSLGRGPVDGIIDRYKPVLRDPALRDQVMKLWVENAVIRLTGARAGMRRKSGAQPGPEGSIGKLAGAEFNQKLGVLELALQGAHATGWDPDDKLTEGVVRGMLRTRANTIEGGTSEIMRNILGERVLGLPKDIDVSRDVAWKDVPRSSK
jgi:alkylation response protein AidB-like acyl-CoA dehydrogenase